MKTKLVVLGNGTDWCLQSLYGLMQYENVEIYNEKLPIKGKIKKKIAKIHFSQTVNMICRLPFKSIWISSIDEFLDLGKFKNKEGCILVYDRNKLGGEEVFINYIKREYPKLKLVYCFTNIVKHSGAKEQNYLEKLNVWYDVVFAFDPVDAEKYNFSYSPLIYDIDPIYDKERIENKDDVVFYVGQAKDRLQGLLSCYEKLKSLGINTDFHIANVNANDIKFGDEICYNKFMTYGECVDSIKKSTCLIDIIQGESTGLTIKTCEAICYDKKLITSNKHIKNYPFYDSRYIRIIETSEDIDESFFSNNRDVRYSKEGKKYFSAEKFLERLETELRKKEIYERNGK